MTTIDQVRAAEETTRREYEAKTVGAKTDGREYTIAQLRAAFEKHHHTPGTAYKRPVGVTLDVTRDDVPAFYEAVIFFHGARPAVENGGTPTTIRLTNTGYAG
jgi:hypothetical protein